MTQYRQSVEEQRIKIEAEEWAKECSQIHVHSLNSMWYDDRPQDTEGGKMVTDRSFNDGSIERTLDNGQVVIMGKRLTGQALYDAYSKSGVK